jgi:hypothetical protein
LTLLVLTGDEMSSLYLTSAAHVLCLLLPAEAQQYDCHRAAEQATTRTPAEVLQAGYF